MPSAAPLFPYTRGPAAFVLDAWVPLAWLIPARGNSYTSGVMGRLSSTTIAIPHPWPMHFAELCLPEEDSGAVSPARTDYFLQAMQSFSTVYESALDMATWNRVVGLARSLSLPVVSASYLELARRLNLPLASVDPTLTAAAAAVNVPIFTP